ncbi:SIR2 family protein [Psychrobacter fozii]|uniref:SIR2-like protein n=1 Tax=Psychrobacter fozii TaxID=198480 RepID=A0A2V4UI67_9GAMM|nr:SIR2 family protein [Psychrobacter fozii]PYE38549.1 SIR2-like protein [Psychrobacter fozii]
MKAKDLMDSGELKHKIRTVKDLVRYVKTKENKDVSNYSIFLGAGASRSSGISTAFELIVEWMEELYERDTNEKFRITNASSENDLHARYNELRNYFERVHASWFDVSNPYSSLFEKKFDLAPQRRRFIEKEVDGRLPSIGYAYLVSLVKHNFFDSIFTTNFDDLVNEAFYQLSNKRPIVCAHDSSVHSISVTSKRPKIIKLHGDYLFEDIKSTLKETESLENNIRDKLIEFCKEYGLIVLGYSGSDRSIMDILEYLIKSDNYLKNGLYWCLREEDEINPKLKSFFWKDGVYPVIIKGFDEFFNELHHELVGSKKIFNTYRESKQQKIIQQIVASKEIFTDERIREDIEALEYESETQTISDYISIGISEDNDVLNNKASIHDQRKVFEIDKLASEDLKEAYEKTKIYYAESEVVPVKMLWLSKLISFSKRLNLDFDNSRWSEEIIEYDRYNFDYYLPKLKNYKKIIDRLYEAEKYDELFNNNYKYLNYKIKLRFEIFDSLKSYKNKSFCEEIRPIVEKSIKIEPSLKNSAWSYKLRMLYNEFNLSSKEKDVKLRIKKEASDLISSARQINSESTYYFGLETYFVNLFDEVDSSKRLLEHLILKLTKASRSERYEIKKLINKLFLNSELDFSYNEILSFYLSEVDPENKNKDNPTIVVVSKARFLLLYDYDESYIRENIESAMKSQDFLDYAEDVIKIVRYLDKEILRKIEIIINTKEMDIEPYHFYNFLSLIKEEQGFISESIDYLNKQYEYKSFDENYFNRKSFLLLKSEKYEDLSNLYKSYKKGGYDFDCEIITINTMYSYKRLESSKFEADLLRNFVNNSKDKNVRIGAKLILGENHHQAIQELIKLVKRDRNAFLACNDWVILSDDDKLKVKKSLTAI